MRTAAAILAMLAVPAVASADDGAARDRDAEVQSLSESIAKDAKALSTDDCVAACKALDSMRRATSRLCSLDPGRKCADARTVLDDATRRVRAACPTCVVPVEEPGGPGAAHQPPMGKGGEHPSPPPPEEARARDSRRGGCLGCGGGSATASSFVGAAAVALVLSRRRKRPR